MPLVCIGLSHRTAPVEVRERHAFPAARMAEALVALHDYEYVREAAMLSTCGRLEIYAELEDYDAGVRQIKRFLHTFRHGDVEDMDSYLYTLLGGQAIEHLFRVSTGLDSMLIGEAEILGQVKDAYIQAQHAQSLGTTLHSLFREALAAGKSARSQTPISSEYVSIATAAVAVAKKRLGTIEGKTVIVIGAGKMGAQAARRLHQEGAADLLVANRSAARAQSLVHEMGAGRAVEMPSLQDVLAKADIVITSTGASHFVLTADNVAPALHGRAERPMLIIDIAVPRDVDPDVAQLDHVDVIGIDELREVVDLNIEQRREAIPRVEEIIGAHVQRFEAWYQTRVAIPVISSLVQKAETIREHEVGRLFARCPDLTERERTLITGTTLTILSKLLHVPVTKIRDMAISNRAEALTTAELLSELFALEPVAPGQSAASASQTFDADE